MVLTTRAPPCAEGCFFHLALVLAHRNREPKTASPATAPSSTSNRGRTSLSSASSQNPHALIWVPFGRWWIQRLPRSVHLKCLTALVR